MLVHVCIYIYNKEINVLIWLPAVFESADEQLSLLLSLTDKEGKPDEVPTFDSSASHLSLWSFVKNFNGIGSQTFPQS